ncbi:shikimate dehydrogenase [uncultured Enterovirga sp.]|uniref:shikimate dehydrogenase n=1 Tax=uncultured Enterovirga sp. TaxID=2026352 RepID=UPI0035CB0C73
MTKAFVIGHPIAHSRSPLIHGFWLREHGLAGSYERIDVPPDELAGFLTTFAERGFVGGNVTVPHKEAVFRLVPASTERAQRLGAVNTLRAMPDGSLLADNTDGIGFAENVADAIGPGWAGEVSSALVLGAGGAARAILGALLEHGIPRIRVANRNPDRAADLARFDPDRVEAIAWNAREAALAGTDLVVNTTSLGMTGQPPLDLDLSALGPSGIVADIVYVPLVTPLLERARARGLRTVEGLGMLLHQAVPGFEAWFGTRPRVTGELRALVEADVEGRR